MLVPRAKYSYFSRSIGLGLLFVLVSVGFGVPVAFAEASMLSSLASFWKKPAPVVEKAEPQNSQNISFLESTLSLDSDKSVGGGDINMSDTAFLPEVSPSGQTIAEIESAERQGKVSLYVVRKGDTLPQIAKLFDVTVNTIVWANDLNRKDALRAGQTLAILPVNGIQHTVQKGETLRGIAKKYKGDIDEIVDFNDLTRNSVLAVGDTVIIPDGIEIAVETPKGSSTVAGPKTTRSRMIAKYPSYEGYYTHPFPTMNYKSQKIHGFNGVDLAGRTGEPVLAAADGVVVISRNGRNGGYGKYIIIEHSNGTQTLYGHMNALYVTEGVRIDKGQTIGEVGNTGRSTGPHLHFEVRGAKNPF